MKLLSFYSMLLYISCACSLSAQHITGHFSLLKGQQVRLAGFNGFEAYTIDSTTVTAQGTFTLNYTTTDYGMGYLTTTDNQPYFVVLDPEGVKLKGKVFSVPEQIALLSGTQNQQFAKYAAEYQKREQALSAWEYLQNLYKSDTLFSAQNEPKQAIVAEMERIAQEDVDFLSTLKPTSYVAWYLPVRKLVSAVSIVAKKRPNEIPALIAAFRELDYTDKRLYKSGLYKDVLDSHFWLIENSGVALDTVFKEMNTSMDHLVANLLADNTKLNEITDYLFKQFEKRSLFKASEYLALKLLNETACTLNANFAAQLESYRAMKIGNIAPDIIFKTQVLAPSYNPKQLPKKLSDLESKYTVVVFGASWCPSCAEELPALAKVYNQWKQHAVEMVFVSLDEDAQLFKNFASVLPFISVCDYQKWEGEAVTDYHVFATPTLFLLDQNQKIILRPNSVKHLEAWMDWHVVQGNK